jgi:hypothetical protein
MQPLGLSLTCGDSLHTKGAIPGYNYLLEMLCTPKPLKTFNTIQLKD